MDVLLVTRSNGVTSFSDNDDDADDNEIKLTATR